MRRAVAALLSRYGCADEVRRLEPLAAYERPLRVRVLRAETAQGRFVVKLLAQQAVSQAQEFGSVANITGIVITKLDGTAKGGIAVTVADQFDMPIKFIGVGEGIDDLKEFVPQEFIGGIFDE